MIIVQIYQLNIYNYKTSIYYQKKIVYFLASNKVRNQKSVCEATSTLDCLRILQDENLFTQTDVIFMQFLCRETKCFDLYKECIEYAEKQKALCYFEKMPGKVTIN